MTPFLAHRLAVCVLACFSLSAVAQTATGFSAKPHRIVVGYPAGQTTDTIARSYAAALSREIGQPVIVDNKAGANGILGAQEVKRATPDGTTLMMGTLGQMAINPALYKNLPYEVNKDFTPVSLVAVSPLVLAATPGFPPNDVKELIAYARDNPGKVNYGSGGNGITGHLAMEILQAQTGIKLTHVPYKGSAAAMTDVIGGQLSLIFDPVTSTLPHLKSGKLKALGVSSSKRNSQLGNVPAIAEQGVTGFDISSWVGIFVPAGTPAVTVDALNKAIRRAAASPEVQQAMKSNGLDPVSESPAYFAKFLQTEMPKWARAVKDSGIQID